MVHMWSFPSSYVSGCNTVIHLLNKYFLTFFQTFHCLYCFSLALVTKCCIPYRIWHPASLYLIVNINILLSAPFGHTMDIKKTKMFVRIAKTNITLRQEYYNAVS